MSHKHTLISCKDCLFAIIQYKQRCMSLASYTLTFSWLCSTVLSIRCVGRCVRYTCWQTRFLCVRLSGSGCLTPPVSLVWRQVRGGHISTVPSDPVPSDPNYCHGISLWKPWLLDSFSTAQPWAHPTFHFHSLVVFFFFLFVISLGNTHIWIWSVLFCVSIFEYKS